MVVVEGPGRNLDAIREGCRLCGRDGRCLTVLIVLSTTPGWLLWSAGLDGDRLRWEAESGLRTTVRGAVRAEGVESGWRLEVLGGLRERGRLAELLAETRALVLSQGGSRAVRRLRRLAAERGVEVVVLPDSG